MNALEEHLPNDLVDLVCGYVGNRDLDAFVDLMKRYRMVMEYYTPDSFLKSRIPDGICCLHISMLNELDKTGDVKSVYWYPFVPRAYAIIEAFVGSHPDFLRKYNRAVINITLLGTVSGYQGKVINNHKCGKAILSELLVKDYAKINSDEGIRAWWRRSGWRQCIT